jgi:hypothetical protein
LITNKDREIQNKYDYRDKIIVQKLDFFLFSRTSKTLFRTNGMEGEDNIVDSVFMIDKPASFST